MTNKHLVTLAVFCLLIALPIGLLINARAQNSSTNRQDDKPALATGYRISGPYTHKNLTVFLVHGKDLLPGKNFLTLQEALAQKKVRVYETKDVNELAIRNLSNQDVYVQAGDIVRGGDQDRMISIDFIVPPRTGRMPIAAFCVESGRWSKRGAEQSAFFSSSENAASTRALKLAAKGAGGGGGSQEAVWENVSVVQRKLSDKLSVDVRAPMSMSSFELTVENTAVKETTAAYINALDNIVRDKPDVIGYAFAINGKVNSADLYANSALFRKLWPKLIRASAIEATSEKKDGKFAACTEADVYLCVSNAEKAKPTTQPSGPRAAVVTKDGTDAILFETRDKQSGEDYLHRNYINKK